MRKHSDLINCLALGVPKCIVYGILCVVNTKVVLVPTSNLCWILNTNAHRHNFDLSTFWFLCSRDTTVLWTVLAPRWRCRCTIMAFICGSIDYNERHDYTIGTLDVLQACDACAGMGKTYAVIVQCADCVVFPNEQLQAFNVSCMRHEQHIHQLIWTQSRQMNATYTEIA